MGGHYAQQALLKASAPGLSPLVYALLLLVHVVELNLIQLSGLFHKLGRLKLQLLNGVQLFVTFVHLESLLLDHAVNLIEASVPATVVLGLPYLRERRVVLETDKLRLWRSCADGVRGLLFAWVFGHFHLSVHLSHKLIDVIVHLGPLVLLFQLTQLLLVEAFWRPGRLGRREARVVLHGNEFFRLFELLASAEASILGLHHKYLNLISQLNSPGD